MRHPIVVVRGPVVTLLLVCEMVCALSDGPCASLFVRSYISSPLCVAEPT